jgi:hypothetical protein
MACDAGTRPTRTCISSATYESHRRLPPPLRRRLIEERGVGGGSPARLADTLRVWASIRLCTTGPVAATRLTG